MQTLLIPAARSAAPPPSPSSPWTAKTSLSPLHCASRPILPFNPSPNRISSLSPSNSRFPSYSPTFLVSSPHTARSNRAAGPLASAPVYTAYGYGSTDDDSEKAKLAQVSRRLENTSRYFKRLGSLGFWGQLVSAVVGAVILSFSIVITGKITSPVTFYATAGATVAAFISVFWSFGYIRLSDKLRRTANEPSKAPPRAEVVKSLKNGIVINLLGMGAAVLGMQATVGLLVGKALTSTANPYYQGMSPGSSPVLALDVFLVQASANTILSHFLGLVFSLELLRSVTLPSSESTPVPRVA